jgi:molecular chaperone DnaK (HSP70)
MSEARYAIGIDLGTTHCALAWIDLQTSEGENTQHGVLTIPQLSSPGQVEQPALLPSFVYLAHKEELNDADLALPWPEINADARQKIVGELARSRGAGTPIRLVSSAKSWLCHPGVDRRAAILPHDAPPEVQRISPLEASTLYLQHIRQAWDHQHPEAPFSAQEITITIPASFDPGARELSAEAARAAAYQNITLLEEPQAALYHWIAASGGGWRKQVKAGDIILVVDVGGGTSDFSLIAVLEQEGQLQLHRVAVGDHILLGGDNMDLTLAHVVAGKLANQQTKLDAWQMRALSYACRRAKENLLSNPELTSLPLVIPSRGSKLIGGSIRSELTRAEVTQTILEGFFPKVAANEHPQQRSRTGLTQLGLPYAQDAGITRHLASLLARQVDATSELPGFNADLKERRGSFLHPSAVLFNGGVFKSDLLTERCLDTINQWLEDDQAPAARMLTGGDCDLAVAQGAAYYGYVRRGQGVRIRGGTARSYYIGIESAMPAIPGITPPMQALCVAPFGMEEGSGLALPNQEFGLVVGVPVFFRFFGSSVRRQDQVGTLLDTWAADELQELNEIQATLNSAGRSKGDVVQVRLQADITEAGTLELSALANDGQRWKVEFDVRGQA